MILKLIDWIPIHIAGIEYWSTPSRRLYITKLPEYQVLGNLIQRKKFSPRRKRGRGEVSIVKSCLMTSGTRQFDPKEEIQSKKKEG